MDTQRIAQILSALSVRKGGAEHVFRVFSDQSGSIRVDGQNKAEDGIVMWYTVSGMENVLQEAAAYLQIDTPSPSVTAQQLKRLGY